MKNPLISLRKAATKKLKQLSRSPEAAILCRSTEGEFKEKINWVDRLYYRAEAERGEKSVDDCFQPGYFELQVPAICWRKSLRLQQLVSHEVAKRQRQVLIFSGRLH